MCPLQGYTPYVVVSKQFIPWFDEHITSGPLGRCLHLEHMHAKGLGFVVHPSAFIVQPAGMDISQALSNTDQKSDVRSSAC